MLPEFSENADQSRLRHPAARLCSRRSSLKTVHWTVLFAALMRGEPLLTHLSVNPAFGRQRGGYGLLVADKRVKILRGAQHKTGKFRQSFFFIIVKLFGEGQASDNVGHFLPPR
jgi:hypothetical protein